MEEQQRQVKGIWIPIEIWKDKNLTWNEKILFLEIDSYTSKEKDCYFSNEYISELLGISVTNASKTISSLIEKGYIVKTKFDGRKRYVKSALSYSTSLHCQEQQGFRACANIIDSNNIDNTNKTTTKEEKELKEKANDEFVDKVYAMYPSKCPVRNTYLGKCAKDKDRIRKLLKIYSKEDIEKVVKKEIEEKYGKCYMQNFSTFLNNFPDPNSLFGDTTTTASEEDVMRRFLELTDSEQAEILQLDAYQYHMLSEKGKNEWRTARIGLINKWGEK